MFRALVSVCALSITAGLAFAQEEGPDVRGVWYADVNPTDKTLLVSDCACEEYTQQIDITCSAKSGTARIQVHDFLTRKGKLGQEAKITFMIDGAATDFDSKLEKFDDGELMPAFSLPVTDPIFEAMSHGKKLKVSYGGKTITSGLKDSRKAFNTMLSYCGT